MRIAFFYPEGSINDPIDVPNIWTSKRGLTGSEVACVMYATKLAELGHSVNIFTKVNYAADQGGVTYIPYREWADNYHKHEWDALCSWMTPEPLKHAAYGAFRFFNQQVSDFGQCETGWENYVDFIAPLSHSHANFLYDQCRFPKEKWRILYNGTDTTKFVPKLKQRGKMIWASSHDRGLHWLLEAFPKIKQEVPEATLHVFYNFHGVRSFASWESSNNKLVEELGRRSRYTLEALKRLEGKGVYAHDSVSRERIRDEMATSEVLAYPLDPVRYTETFGVTVLEACASGAVPVICTADAFKELWSDCSVCVPAPYPDNKEEFLRNTVRVLSDDQFRNRYFGSGIRYAKLFDWDTLVRNLERFLMSRGEYGLPEVHWQ